MKTYPKNPINFHLWFPNIFEFKGGIQVYCAVLLEALQNLCKYSEYDVFLKHDTTTSPDLKFLPNTRFHCAGNWPENLRTPAFATQILTDGLWQKPKLIVASHINFAPVAYLLKRLVGVPYWVIVYGVDAWDIKRYTLKTALHHADKIISISEYTRDRLSKEQNLDPAKISLLPCTFDVSRFQITSKPSYLLERYHLKPDQPVILTVARLDNTERYKGYDQIIFALPQIQHQIPNVHYLIVGKGNDRPRVDQLITKLNLQESVTLAGFIPDHEINDHYNLCDVFAMPSKGEGFGIVYLEALACGKPALGGNQDGAIDALSGGELGVLVDPDDVNSIAENLTQILQKKYPHPTLYQPEILRQRVIEKFGFERFQETVAQLIKNSHLQTVIPE